MSPQPPSPLGPVTIERLGFGGDGVGRLPDGRVAFVRGALPGDVVQIQVRKNKKRFVQGQIHAFVQRSASRVEPLCPLADGRCGGCQLWGASAQDAWLWKRQAAVEALERAGRLRLEVPVEAVQAPSDQGYRRRLRLKINERGQMGFYAAGSHRLTQIPDCLVAHPTLLGARDALQGALGGLGGGSLLLELDADGQRAVGLLQMRHHDKAARRLKGRLKLGGALGGVRLKPQNNKRGSVVDMGDVHFTLRADGMDRRLTVGAFTQANDAINEALIERTLAALDLKEGQRVLELYCGAGNFSFSVARAGAEVRGYELDAGAIDAARQGADTHFEPPQRSRLSFDVRDLSVGLPAKDTQPGRYERVLLDPPRTGAKEVVADLLKLAAKRIVYVSCDPPTLGRDLGLLLEGGAYRLESLTAFDMFPRTYHVEMLAVLVAGEPS